MPTSRKLSKPRLLKLLRRFHLIMMVVWALLAIPTLLWWRDSVLWVAFLSLYANFASEFAAWHASGAEDPADSSQEPSKE